MNISHAQIIDSLGGITAVATRLGIKPPSVFGWIEMGRNGIPDGRLIELGAEIETATKGECMRKDIRPHDWHLIWPELAAAPAPQEPWDGTERRKLDAQGECSRPACEVAAAVPVGMVLIPDRRSPDAPADRRVSPESVSQAAFKLDQQGAQQEGV